MRTRSQRRTVGIAFGGAAAALLVAAISSPRLRRSVAGRFERQGLDINLDHGLADCPWADKTDRLDPEGEVRIDEPFVVVRSDHRVYFSGRVVSLTCYSAYLFGPAIALEVRSWDPPANANDPAPPLDPEVNHAQTDLPALLATYRRAHGIVGDFALSPEEAARARQALDKWYGGNSTFRLDESLGFAGALATGEIFVSQRTRDDADIRLLFGFQTDVDPSGEVMESWKHDLHRQRRVKICLPRSNDNGAPPRPPSARAQSESARARFAPCPGAR